jgi:hypothetical protein
MRNLRQAIIDQTLQTFVESFMRDWYGTEPIPNWVTEALEAAGIDVR